VHPQQAAVVPQTSGVQPSGGTAQDEEVAKDLSGTNPALFTNAIILSNEYAAYPGEASPFVNQLLFRYSYALFDRRLQARIKTPFEATSRTASGQTEWGVGDFTGTFSYKPYVSKRFIVLTSLELGFPTGRDASTAFTSGKFTATPLVTGVMIFPNGMLFAPTVGPKLSYAGDADRDDIRQTQIDLYYVWRPTRIGWIIVDPQFVVDHAHGNRVVPLVRVEFGRVMNVGVAANHDPGVKRPSAMSAYIRPGMGFGSHRPYDWSLELGLKVVH
jgi:hypothetical protein